MSTTADALMDRGDAASGRRWQGTVVVLASAFAFSTAGLFTRLVETDVWTMLFWRGLFGGLLIAGYVVWRDGAGAMAALRRIGRPGLIAAGCSTAATICFINALRQTAVADVLVINATAPFVTAIMAWVWTGVVERRRTLLASAVALLGVVAMVVPTLGSGPGSGRLLGNALALAMTVLISGMMVVMRHHRAVCMLPAAALSAFLCALVVWPWADPLSVTASDFGWLVLFGTTQFGLGQLLLTIGLRSISATRSALIGALETPLAPALVWIVLGEVPAVMTCVGGAIVLAAVVGDVLGARRQG
ncbi:MAG: DMT family transporter [Reyranella sp.]|jgi:drug/metabolite transporter (DMT)-like permease|nr:DMT family transporter [Reyranella sp.]